MSDKKIRIVALSHSAELGGGELALLSLIQNTQDTCSWTVIVPRQGPYVQKLRKLATIKTIPLPWWCHEAGSTPLPISKKMLEKSLRKLEAVTRDGDVLLTNTITVPWMGIMATKHLLPHLWYIHEFGDLDHHLQFFAGYQRSLKFISETSTAIITISRAVMQHLTENGLAKNKVSILRQGIDLGLVQTSPKSLPNNPSDIRILLLGAIKESKGQETAIKAIIELAKHGIHPSLKIKGPIANASYGEKIQQLVSAHPECRIEIAPGFADPKADLAASHIVLICSSQEALGRVTIEAMAAGKIIIGNAGGATKELLKDNRGILYERTADSLADHLQALINKRLVPPDTSKAQAYANKYHDGRQEKLDFLNVLSQVSVPQAYNPPPALLECPIQALMQAGALSTQAASLRATVRRQALRPIPRPIKRLARKLLR